MSPCSRSTRWLGRPATRGLAAAAALALALVLGPGWPPSALAQAVDEETSAVGQRPPSWLEWDHSWSLWKWLILAALMLLLWEAAFHFVFKGLVDPRRTHAPWPRDCFARAMSFFYASSILGFIVCFGVLSDALRNRKDGFVPSELRFLLFLNSAWPMALAALLMLIGYFAVFGLFRRSRKA
jgi:hypothetical protein